MSMNCSLIQVLSASVVLALACSPSVALGQEEAPKKPFFLPKNPTAAAYVLNRLSNKELIEAPRSEYVYMALLQRKGLDRKYRLEALEGLSKARHTDVVTETIGGITQLDKNGAEFEDVLRELAGLLLQAKPAELASKRAELALLANSGELPLTRQIGYAALMTAHGSVKQVW